METINFIQNIASRILIGVIYVYRYLVSALLGDCCRFEPTCSSYAIQAIKRHGSLKGCWLTIKRLLRCHPWHVGGDDPVPLTQRSRLC